MIDDRALLAEQLAYYRARAPEYDDWFHRRGRYDHGDAANRTWHEEVARVRAALRAVGGVGDVLELACGTGLWSVELLPLARTLTALDGAPEALSRCRRRLAGSGLATPFELRRADLFAWLPSARYDLVFFAFWLSHVPPQRFDDFWVAVRACLGPGGRVFLVDSLPAGDSGARDHPPPDRADGTAWRRLDDGRRFRVVKVFHTPASLAARLRRLGFRTRLRRSGRFFLYGTVTPR